MVKLLLKRDRYLKFALCVCFLGSTVFFLTNSSFPESQTPRNDYPLLRQKSETKTHHHNHDALASRPMMHTFYENSDVGEDDLLEYWKEAWNEAGWDTVVLTMEDAKKHPYYDEMFSVIDPIWGMTYNGLCFYRWLAMAASGGGWMSDYDLFPTNFPKEEGFMDSLPNRGDFTSFYGHVPSLMSGREDE